MANNDKISIGQFLRPNVPSPDDSSSPSSVSEPSAPPGMGVRTYQADEVPLNVSADESVQRIYTEIDKKGEYSETGGGAPGSKALDPFLWTKNTENMAEQLGTDGLAKHAAIQAGLQVLNDTGRVWNPGSVSPPPIVVNFVPIALDTLVVGTHEEQHGPGAEDVHLNIAKGVHTETKTLSYPPFVKTSVLVGSTGPQNITSLFNGSPFATSQDGAIIDDVVKGYDGRVEPIVAAGMRQRNVYDPEVQYGKYAINSLGKLIDDVIDKNIAPVLSNEYTEDPNDTKLGNAAFVDGKIPIGFDEEFKEGDKGFVTSVRGQQSLSAIDDDEAYLPLAFTDLRPIAGGNRFRTVYFRPFITNLTEEFSPEWNKSNYIGRVDPVATYMATGRTISLGFKVVVFGPEDLEIMYHKLSWLSSMVYPEYDRNLVMKSGPVVRMRIGDVVNASGPGNIRGIPGIIDSLAFDYTDALWELKKNWKLPRNINVSLNFVVLHDKPIGRSEDGTFGGIGWIDENGKYNSPEVDNGVVESSHAENFRMYGNSTLNDYPDRLKALPPPPPRPPEPPQATVVIGKPTITKRIPDKKPLWELGRQFKGPTTVKSLR